MKRYLFLFSIFALSPLFLSAGPRFHSGIILSAKTESGLRISGITLPAGFHFLRISVELDKNRGLWKGDYSLIVKPSGKEIPCLALRMENGMIPSSGTIPSGRDRKQRAELLFGVPDGTSQAALRFLLFTTGEPLRFFSVMQDDPS